MEPIMAQVLGGQITPRLILEIVLAIFGLETIRLMIAELAANLLEKRTESWMRRRSVKRRRRGAHLHRLFLLKVRPIGNKQHVHAVVHYLPREKANV